MQDDTPTARKDVKLRLPVDDWKRARLAAARAGQPLAHVLIDVLTPWLAELPADDAPHADTAAGDTADAVL